MTNEFKDRIDKELKKEDESVVEFKKRIDDCLSSINENYDAFLLLLLNLERELEKDDFRILLVKMKSKIGEKLATIKELK